MAKRDKIQLRRITKTYPDLFQENYAGASATGSERGWWPNIPALAGAGTIRGRDYLRVGPFLYFTGLFDTVGGTTRNNAACVDLRTNTLTAWDPDLDDEGQTLATDGTYIYIGGLFTDVNSGTTRNRICRVNATTGVVEPTWDPDANDDVDKIIISGSRVFTSGDFTTVNGVTTRNSLAEFSITSDVAQATFDVDANARCRYMDFDADSQIIYLVGNFSTLDGGTARNRAGAWDTDADALTAWDPDLNGTARSVKILNANSIWLGGDFTTVNGGTARQRLSAFNSSGTIITPDFLVDARVRAVCVDDDRTGIYVGGNLGSVLGTARNKICKIDVATSTLDPWDPDANGNIFSCFVFQNTAIMGGQFTTIKSVAQVGTAMIPDPLFDDANSIFINKTTGDDANAGTAAAPKKTLAGAQATTLTLADTSGNGFTLTETGVNKMGSRHTPAKTKHGNFCAGPFSPTQNLNIPAGVGTAINATSHFTFECYLFLRDLSAQQDLWYYQAASGDQVFRINTDGSVMLFVNTISGTSPVGLIKPNEWMHVAFTFDGATKKLFINNELVYSVAQVAVVTTHVAHKLGVNPGLTIPVRGWVDRVRIYDEPETSFPGTSLTNIQAIYNFDTVPAINDKNYIVVQDSETYEERFETLFPDDEDFRGLYADDGQAPKITMPLGYTPGTVGARVTGRAKFSTGAAATFYHVSKGGDDSTGARGNAALPFLTIQGALSDGARLTDDTIQIEDNGIYVEDLILGALNTTIQAADGLVPTLTAASTALGDFHISGSAGGTDLNLYGLNILQPSNSQITVWDNVDGTGNSGFYDCTFVGGAIVTISISNTSTGSFIENCIFDRVRKANGLGAVLGAVGKIEVRNCLFIRLPQPGLGVRGGLTRDDVALIERCSFIDSSDIAIGIIPLVAEKADTVVRDCFFDQGDFSSSVSQAGAILVKPVDGSGLMPDFSAHIQNCHVKNYTGSDGAGVRIILVSNNPLFFSGYLLIEECVFDNCTSGVYSQNTINNFAQDFYLHVLNDLAMNCTIGFNMTWSTGGGLSITHKNCVALNCSSTGFVYGAATEFIDGLIEKGSGTSGISGASTIDNSCVETSYVSSAVQSSSSFLTDPKLVAVGTDIENVALSISSVGLLSGNDNRSLNMGLMQALVVLDADGAVINGITLEGAENFYGGVRIGEALGRGRVNTKVLYCTFEDLGPYGVFTPSSTTVEKNFFTSLNGPAVISGGVNSIIKRNAGATGASGFIIIGSAAISVINNSGHAFASGQVDIGDVPALIQKNNIYSGSGDADYTGSNIQTFGDIGTLSPNAQVDVNSIRQDPLFRDRVGGDLRLQAIAVGFPFDSPALLIGDDGFDMGVFAFVYGSAVDSGVVIDFSSSGYRNPDEVDESFFGAKLAEGEREDGSSYSRAATFKKEWVLIWRERNDMPEAQRQALEDFFTNDNPEIELSQDGGATFNPVTIMKNDGFRYKEVTQTYVDDAIPRPVAQITLREK